MKNVVFITLILLLVTSCKKSESSIIKVKLKTKPIEMAQLKEILTELKAAKVYNFNTPAQFTQSIDPAQIQDEKIATIIEPLVLNGKELQTELLSIIENSAEWEQIPEAEKEILLNLSDEQLADLSITYGISGITGGAIHDCVGAALGLAGLKSLMSGLVTGPTVSTAIGILKWVGKRYLSYIGIAWVLWDFMDCISHF